MKKYYKVIDGKKYISVEALVEEGITPQVEKVENGLKSTDTTPPAVLAALEILEKQLAEKDLQIARLQEETQDLRKSNAEKDAFIQEQSGKIVLLLEQAQELNRNNQVLLGVEKGITPQVEKVEEGITPPVEAQDSPEEEKHRGFWRRLFIGKHK